MKRILHSIIILLSLTIALTQQTYADSFSATALTSRYSSSPYAGDKNAFKGDLAGQCTWYAYGRVIELAEKGELDSQAAALLYAALWGKTGRDAKNWPNSNYVGGTWHCTSVTPLPIEKRRKGLLAVWNFGEHGHVGFVEEVSADKSQYRLSDFNYYNDTNYREKWYPFVGNDSIGGAYPCFYELPLPSTGNASLTYFDGAGSLISPSQSGFGANTDIANMHANPSRTSTAVFQFLNSSDQCHHVDISSSLSEAIIQVKNWGDHEILTAYKGALPISVPSQGTWTVVAVTSTQPLTTDYVSVRAKCKTSSDPLTSSYHNRTALDMKLIPLDSDYYWTGTGSIMSFLGSGTGKTSDFVPTFYSHKSLSSFQWYASSSCSKLTISGGSGSTSLYGDNEVAIKNWSRNKDGWGGNLCSSLPCTISRPNSIDDFYIVKVKTNANATGGSLSAECTN